MTFRVSSGFQAKCAEMGLAQSGMSFRRTSTRTDMAQLNTPLKLRLYQMLHSQIVEYGMSLVILGNFALIIAETNINASEDDVPVWMGALSWSVLVLFAVELIVRLYVGGSRFFADPWNCFDFFIITADIIFSVIAELFESLMPISLLRILRLAKVARISKVVRVFPELRLMIGGLAGAMRAIMWGTVLMAIALLICAVLAVQFIHPLTEELAQKGVWDELGCLACHGRFSTVQAAALTFWQTILAGDAWGQLAVPIIENYPAAAVYFLGVFLLLALALHNLILGVIVDVAQESRKKLQQDADKKTMMMRMETQENLLQMCADMDTDHSGCLTKQELLEGYDQNEDLRRALADLDVQQADLDVVWLLMDKDRTGYIHYDEFVTELYNMRSSESQFMLTYIKFYVTVIKDRILEEIRVVEDGMKTVSDEVMNAERIEEQIQNKLQRLSLGNEEMLRQLSPVIVEEGTPGDASQQEQFERKGILEGSKLNKRTDEAFADLVKEIRESQASVTSRLEALDAKVETCMMEQLQRMRASVSWSLPLPCQSVAHSGQKVVIQTPAPSRQQSDRVFVAPARNESHEKKDPGNRRGVDN